MEIAQARSAELREDLENAMVVRDAHELMRALEAGSVLDCADMAAFASLPHGKPLGALPQPP